MEILAGEWRRKMVISGREVEGVEWREGVISVAEEVEQVKVRQKKSKLDRM